LAALFLWEAKFYLHRPASQASSQIIAFKRELLTPYNTMGRQCANACRMTIGGATYKKSSKKKHASELASLCYRDGANLFKKFLSDVFFCDFRRPQL